MKGSPHIDVYGPASSPADSDFVIPDAASNARPLSYWRQRFARTGAYVLDLDRERAAISLQLWAEAPEDTMFAIYAEWVDPNLVGNVDPLDGPQGCSST